MEFCVTEICAFKDLFQRFSATLPNQSVPQKTFHKINLIILAKNSFFLSKLNELRQKRPKFCHPCYSGYKDKM